MKQCINKECCFVWLDPAPHETELWKLYTNYYTHTGSTYPAIGTIKRYYFFIRDCYLALRFGYCDGLRQYKVRWLGFLLYLFPSRRANVDYSVMYLTNKSGGKLLEIGCGNGGMLKNMNLLGWQTEGVDFDPAAVEIARAKGLKVNLGSLHDQEYVDSTFDAVILSHVIEHVPNPLALLSEIHRILKPGGIISLVTPNFKSLGRNVFGSSWLHLDPPRHLFLFDPNTLINLTQTAGFTKLSMVTTIRDAAGLFYASFMLKRKNKFIMGTQPQAIVKLILLITTLIEWAVIKIFRNKGEEIAFIGVK